MERYLTSAINTNIHTVLSTWSPIYYLGRESVVKVLSFRQTIEFTFVFS